MRVLKQACTAGLLMLPLLTSCSVETHKNADGEGKDVAIKTPLGGMSVKTDAATVQSRLGLPLYPGAVLKVKTNKDDNGSADVNMNFGSFHLRVLAMGFQSSDSPDKVSAYYRKALTEYSDVIECRGKKAVGKPDRTGLGLTCNDDGDKHSGTGRKHDDNELELKAGSPSKQHIVSVKPADGGTEFGLVSLELPKDDEKGN
jgi:hypothetical protein